jgi:hypothetical protein
MLYQLRDTCRFCGKSKAGDHPPNDESMLLPFGSVLSQIRFRALSLCSHRRIHSAMVITTTHGLRTAQPSTFSRPAHIQDRCTLPSKQFLTPNSLGIAAVPMAALVHTIPSSIVLPLAQVFNCRMRARLLNRRDSGRGETMPHRPMSRPSSL